MRGGTVFWALVAAGMMLGQAVAAPAAGSFKVGVIQQRTVVEKTKAGKRAMDLLKEFQASRQRIISADDEELKKLEAALKSQGEGADEAQKRERQEKQEQFRIKFENYQRRLQDFNREIQEKQQELTMEFQKKLDETVRVVAEKRGFAAVIDVGGAATIQVVLYAHSSIDLTDQVIREFDRRNK